MTSKASRTLVGIVAALALAAPAAQAMPSDSPQHGSRAHVASPAASVDLRSNAGTSSLAGTTSPPARPVIEPAPATGGFDWLSAAIGAVVATGLALASWTTLGMRRPARA